MRFVIGIITYIIINYTYLIKFTSLVILTYSITILDIYYTTKRFRVFFFITIQIIYRYKYI